MRAVHRSIAVAFFLSGFAALLYQLVWQRALFAIYGINTEAVTVVVTAFMLGLGVGNHAGGVLSSRSHLPPIWLFALFELGLAVFGLLSLPLFGVVGAATLHLSAVPVALITFALVLIPTLLMGATLPLLVSHAVRTSGNVGRSVGDLYFVNTLGSAIASIAVVVFLFRWLGQSGVVWLAASCNLGVAAVAFRQARGATA